MDSGECEKLLNEPATVGSPILSRDGSRLAFTLEDEKRLAEVWVKELGSGAMRQLTHFNESWLDSLALQPAEEFWFTNDAGLEVQGFLVRPVRGTRSASSTTEGAPATVTISRKSFGRTMGASTTGTTCRGWTRFSSVMIPAK